MSQPYLYDPQANVLRQRAEMREPLIKEWDPMWIEGKSRWTAEWENYNAHIASLPAYTPVSGWVPEVGRTYELDKNFRIIRSCTNDDDMCGWGGKTCDKCVDIAFELIEGKTIIPGFTKIAVPIEQKQECKHPHSYTSADSGIQYCVDCDRPVGNVNKKDQQSFTLQDMIECWEVGRMYGEAFVYYNQMDTQTVEARDKKEYFKSKGIDLP